MNFKNKPSQKFCCNSPNIKKNIKLKEKKQKSTQYCQSGMKIESEERK